MARKRRVRAMKPRITKRHAIPYVSSRNQLRFYETNWHTTDRTDSVTSMENFFACPESLITGDRRKPNPWWFKKQATTHLNGRVDFDTPASWQGPASHVEFRGALGPYFNWDNHWWSVDQDHSRVTDPNYDKDTYNRALARLYDDVRQTDLNALLSSYELKELTSLRKQMSSSLSTMVKTLAQTEYAVRRKRNRVERVITRVIPGASALAAGSWLTYAYVVRPALSDMAALKDFTALLTADKACKGSASIKWVNEWRDQESDRRRVTDIGAIKTKIKMNIGISDAAEFDAWRLGFRSPASFLYESVPFSFVLDWVYNLGTYFSSLEASYGHGWYLKDGWRTSTAFNDKWTRYDKAWQYYGIGAAEATTVTENSFGTSSYKRSERVVITHLPGPRTPSLDLDLASSQLLSAAALLRTLGFK